MKNSYYTIMIVPEKTTQVRRWVIPSWLFKGAAVTAAILILLTLVMLVDYGFVMSRITENKQLQLENRKLRIETQVMHDKLAQIESTVDRMKTFATRLKVITNTEDHAGLLERLNKSLPEAARNVGAVEPRKTLSPDELFLQGAQDKVEAHLKDLSTEALYVEQMLQDQYELLADKKAFLLALPTRKPAEGRYTSGFGIRNSPFGDRVKMHEGIDIANHAGTTIHAPADGVVLAADARSGYGRTLVIDHGYGLETWYGHTRQILVSSGQRVRRGDQIALMGNTGRSTGPHVHYEVRINGTPVDPLSYILEN